MNFEKDIHDDNRDGSQSPEILEQEVKELAGLPADFVPPTPEEEAAVIRKLDWRLLPYVFLLYMLAVLDRSNLGNAKVAGLQKAVNLGGWNYNWLGTIFYIACELPSSSTSKLFVANPDQISYRNGHSQATRYFRLIDGVQHLFSCGASLPPSKLLLSTGLV